MFDHKNLLSIDELSAEDIMTVLTYAKTFEEVEQFLRAVHAELS